MREGRRGGEGSAGSGKEPDEHTRSVRARFSAGAPGYEARAGIQRRAAEELAQAIGPAERGPVLEVGCGTGLLTRLLAARFPLDRITAIDVSERMVEETRRLLPNPRVEVLAGDALHLDLSERFGLAVSSCAIHWMRPLGGAIAVMARHLLPGGLLAVSVMLEGTLAELHEARLRAAPAKPPLARLPSMDEFLLAARAAGVRLERSWETSYRSFSSSARQLLGDLHLQGLSGGDYSRGSAPLTRGEIDATIAGYEARHRKPEGVVATYRVAFLLGRRSPAGSIAPRS